MFCDGSYFSRDATQYVWKIWYLSAISPLWYHAKNDTLTQVKEIFQYCCSMAPEIKRKYWTKYEIYPAKAELMNVRPTAGLVAPGDLPSGRMVGSGLADSSYRKKPHSYRKGDCS